MELLSVNCVTSGISILCSASWTPATPQIEVRGALMKSEEALAEYCGNVDGPGFHMDASQAPMVHLTTKNNTRRWDLWKWTLLLHCLPWWAPKREKERDQKGKGELAGYGLAHTSTGHNKLRHRSKGKVRKWKRAIQWSCTVSTLGIYWMLHNRAVLSYWITTIIIKGHTISW